VDAAGLLVAAERGQVPPVVLLHGPDPFLLQDAVTRLTRALLGPGADLDFCREVLEAREVGAERIVESALLLPWTGGRRLVVVRGAETLPARQGEPLAAYARTPNPATALVLLAEGPLDPGHWLVRAVPPGAVVPVPGLVGRALAGWLVERARAEGWELDEAAAALLVELVGDDPGRLLGEVERAALHGGPDNLRVGPDEVRAVVGETRVRHVFELGRALVRGDRAAALRLLEALLAAGEEPLGLLGLLGREIRACWQAAEGLRHGRTPEDVARALRRPPAAAGVVLERARTLGPAEAGWMLGRCWEAERRLKLGAPPRPELSLLVADLCVG
jgi:DNA polymerase-3 subunit delta